MNDLDNVNCMLQVMLLKIENNFGIKLKINYCELYSQMCKMI